jgi:hypothetical protein
LSSGNPLPTRDFISANRRRVASASFFASAPLELAPSALVGLADDDAPTTGVDEALLVFVVGVLLALRTATFSARFRATSLRDGFFDDLSSVDDVATLKLPFFDVLLVLAVLVGVGVGVVVGFFFLVIAANAAASTGILAVAATRCCRRFSARCSPRLASAIHQSLAWLSKLGV